MRKPDIGETSTIKIITFFKRIFLIMKPLEERLMINIQEKLNGNVTNKKARYHAILIKEGILANSASNKITMYFLAFSFLNIFIMLNNIIGSAAYNIMFVFKIRHM